MLPEELSAVCVRVPKVILATNNRKQSDLKHIDTELRRKPDQIDRSIAFPS